MDAGVLASHERHMAVAPETRWRQPQALASRPGLFGDPFVNRRRYELTNLCDDAQRTVQRGAGRPAPYCGRKMTDRGGFGHPTSESPPDVTSRGTGYSTSQARRVAARAESQGLLALPDSHRGPFRPVARHRSDTEVTVTNTTPAHYYVYGELGIRLEDLITITPDGAENLTRWSGSPEEPAVV